jgi:transcriptional regulator with XRE-family HTH domain
VVVGQHWPETARRTALRLRREERLTAPQIARRLKTDHGFAVPRKTVDNWLSRPIAEGQDVGQLARRAMRLAELDLASLERSTTPIDLDRLAKLAAVLKTLQPLVPTLPKAARSGRDDQIEDLPPTTLQDLSEAQETESEGPFVAHRT